MSTLYKPIVAIALGAAAMISFAQVTVSKGTDVDLQFMQRLNSKKVVAGQKVQLTVAHNVNVDGRTVLKKGTPVTAVITKVDHRDHFGKNARLRLAINPIHVRGGWIDLQPRDKQSITGRRSDTAGAASAGGAIVLGPIGLLGGYFVVGKPVKVQIGDPLYTEVSRTVVVQ